MPLDPNFENAALLRYAAIVDAWNEISEQRIESPIAPTYSTSQADMQVLEIQESSQL